MVFLNGREIKVTVEKGETVSDLRKKISDEPVYLVARQKRYVSSRQIYYSPVIRTALCNANLKIKEPKTFFELLELEIDGERDIWTAMGVKLPPEVPAHPLFIESFFHWDPCEIISAFGPKTFFNFFGEIFSLKRENTHQNTIFT